MSFETINYILNEQTSFLHKSEKHWSDCHMDWISILISTKKPTQIFPPKPSKKFFPVFIANILLPRSVLKHRMCHEIFAIWSLKTSESVKNGSKTTSILLIL